MRSIVLAAAAGALLCSPAIAGKSSTADGNSKDKLVCKAIDVTSTRIARKKACMTRAQWKQHDEEQAALMRKQQRSKGSLGDGGSIPGRGIE